MSIICDIEQRTSAWQRWRRRGIGASDAPVIMGVSKWRDADELWHIKTGRLRLKDEPTPAMLHGLKTEPRARRAYVQWSDNRVRPVCMEHAAYRWMRASCDGINRTGDIVLEIKCPLNPHTHRMANYCRIPEYYLPQIQHLLVVSGALVCHYWSYLDGDGAIVHVEPDIKYMKELFRREEEFWKYVMGDRRPPRRRSTHRAA